MSSPVFSIIIATYNRQDLLPCAIGGALRQTFRDFELIIVDNGSTDNTRFVVERMQDPRIRYVLNSHPTNSCDVPRNIGIRLAKGAFVSFLDDDDIWYPERLEKVKRAFDDHKDISCVCHDENRITNGRAAGVLRYGPWAEDLYEQLIYDGNRFSPCATTIKSDLLRRLNGFDEREEFSEVADYDLWIRMAKEGAKVHFIHEPLGEFRLTGNNWSTVNPMFGAKQAAMIRGYMLEHEKRHLFQISRRGLKRLFQLYYIAGRGFLKAGRYKEALPYFLISFLFIARRPRLIADLYAKVREKWITENFQLPIYNEENCVFYALGRNAMYAACKILGLKAGDEVLTPAFDCDTALQPFRVIGCRMQFYRSDPYSFSADINDIKRRISKNTRLLHIINHFGMPQPWNELLALRQETGIPILEDNAYSLFSKLEDKPFGMFGDFSVFSLRKNLPLTDGGFLRINNIKYTFRMSDNKTPWCYPTEYPKLSQLMVRSLGLACFLKSFAKKLGLLSEIPPPLYSDGERKYPDWPPRDAIGREFSCDYLRPMSKIAGMTLSKFTFEDFTDIADKKRYFYNKLASGLNNIEGVKILWPELPEGAVPFCLSCLVSSGRDIFLKVLSKRYDVMAWPTLSKLVLDQLEMFPEIILLGKRLLQINLPSDKVRSSRFPEYVEKLIKEMHYLSTTLS